MASGLGIIIGKGFPSQDYFLLVLFVEFFSSYLYFLFSIWGNSTWNLFWLNLLSTSMLIIFKQWNDQPHVEIFPTVFYTPIMSIPNYTQFSLKVFYWLIFALGKKHLVSHSFFSPVLRKAKSQVKKAAKAMWRWGVRQQRARQVNKGTEAWWDSKVKSSKV